MKPADTEANITIGQFAQTAGVNVETIRYYQRIALLPLPKRNHGSIRRYSANDLKRVRFIRRAQALGFSADADFETIVRAYIEDELIPGKAAV